MTSATFQTTITRIRGQRPSDLVGGMERKVSPPYSRSPPGISRDRVNGGQAVMLTTGSDTYSRGRQSFSPSSPHDQSCQFVLSSSVKFLSRSSPEQRSVAVNHGHWR